MCGRFDSVDCMSHNCRYPTRYAAVVALMIAAKAHIYLTKMVYNSHLSGCTICDRYEMDPERYAMDTALDNLALTGDRVRVTTEYIDGVGPVVTMINIIRGTVRETYIYDIEVDPNSDDYDGNLARDAIDAIHTYDICRELYIRSILNNSAVIIQHIEARNNLDGDTHTMIDQETDAEAAADTLSIRPDCADGDEGINTVIAEYEPLKLPYDFNLIPARIAVRDNVYHRHARMIVSQWWLSEFDISVPEITD